MVVVMKMVDVDGDRGERGGFLVTIMIVLVKIIVLVILRTMVISVLPTATIGTSMRTGAPSVGGRGCTPRPRM